MCSRACRLVLMMVSIPGLASAQSTVSGAAEWTVAKTNNTSEVQTNSSSAFWQNYSAGLHTALWDPRLVKLDTELGFRTNRLTTTGSQVEERQGRQNDLGFQVGAAILPTGAVPFHVQASRLFAGSSGELAFTNPARGGLVRPLDAAATGFDTEQRHLSLGGRFNMLGLPHADVSYRRGQAIALGGIERAEQRDDDLSASIVQETPRVRQSLRYQQTTYEYALTQVFNQSVDTLDYDFTAKVRDHIQLTARAGQRSTEARSELVTGLIDSGGQPYAPPPTDGHSSTTYANGGFSFEPNSRVTLRVNGTWDEQRSAAASTQATLATGSLHAMVLRGLTINTGATMGERGQVIADRRVQVRSTSGVAGATYSEGPHWLNGTVSANVGRGVNPTPDGGRAATESWSREVSLSSSMGWFGAGAGYGQSMSRDAVLDYGNYDSTRARASVSMQSGRMSLTGSADQIDTTRGFGDTLAENRQQIVSATLAGRLWRETMLTATAGGFSTNYLSAVNAGLDRSTFWGVGAQVAMRRSLRLSGWIRSEDVFATTTTFRQQGLSALARLEYRLRTVFLTLDYRRNDNELQYGGAALPTLFSGSQVRFSLTRRFGFAL